MKFSSYLYKCIHRYASFYNIDGKQVLELIHQSSAVPSLDHAHQLKSADALTDKDIALVQNFDFRILLLNGLVHFLSDIQNEFERLGQALSPNHRLIVIYYSRVWKPIIRFAEICRLKRKAPRDNWITSEDLDNFCQLTGFEVIKTEKKVLLPIYLPLITPLFNKLIVNFPFIRHLALINIALIRPVKVKSVSSATIVVPARNEEGNIEEILRRLPQLSRDDEVIFVEGNSTDNTWQKIQEVTAKSDGQIQAYQQPGKGKADAVRLGFEKAQKEVLMILDADMTVPPEDLPKFYNALANNQGEYINGSRMVYPMEKKAMRFFNMLGNKFFAMAFSYLLGQSYRDTLCGTKVIHRDDYELLVQNRSYFGDFDPFGDFDLIFGASKLGLKTIEVPVRYRERTYGSTNISRWKHGLILLRMLVFASRKIKFI